MNICWRRIILHSPGHSSSLRFIPSYNKQHCLGWGNQIHNKEHKHGYWQDKSELHQDGIHVRGNKYISTFVENQSSLIRPDNISYITHQGRGHWQSRRKENQLLPYNKVSPHFLCYLKGYLYHYQMIEGVMVVILMLIDLLKSKLAISASSQSDLEWFSYF